MSKEIISKFGEKPKYKKTWWAMYTGLAAFIVPFFLGIFTALIRPIVDKASVNNENTGIAM